MSEVVLSTLTREEDNFALALMEYGGNLGAAYVAAFGRVPNPSGKARDLLSRPEIAKRVMELQTACTEQSMISVGSHLQELAHIRDLAIYQGQLKVALSAEQARGEVAGMYADKQAPRGARSTKDGGPKAAVNIFIGARTPGGLDEWSDKQGVTPVVIDVASKQVG